MSNRTMGDAQNSVPSVDDVMDTANDIFKSLDKTIRKQLDERPYTVLGVVAAAAWLYAKIR
jgi:hypothetical protein